MIRAIIADDEPLSRRVVQQLLARHADVMVVAECADGERTREAIDQHNPDVVFLDIRMPLASGFEVAHARNVANGPMIVFVTAFDQFALRAFDVDAVDYLTKPLIEHRFDLALTRVRARLLPRARDTDAFASHLTARRGNQDVIIPLDSVEFIEADDVYAVVVTRGRRHLLRTPLDTLQRTLDPQTFLRVHRSYIVRIDRVAAVERHGSGAAVVIMRDGARLPVSRRRRISLDALRKPFVSTEPRAT